MRVVMKIAAAVNHGLVRNKPEIQAAVIYFLTKHTIGKSLRGFYLQLYRANGPMGCVRENHENCLKFVHLLIVLPTFRLAVLILLQSAGCSVEPPFRANLHV